MKDAIRKRNTAVVKHPVMTPRRKSAQALAPSNLRINTPSIVAYAGNGVSSPLKCGPNIVAHSVINKTTVVAAIIRAGISRSEILARRAQLHLKGIVSKLQRGKPQPLAEIR
jgi:hypothetical protein